MVWGYKELSMNKIKKVLFLGGGRRVTLAYKFIEKGFDVYSYELDIRVPVSSVANIIKGLYWSHTEFNTHLFKTINKYDIDLVIPLMDMGVVALASANLYNKTNATFLVSNINSSNICADKQLFERFIFSSKHDYLYPSIEKDFGVISKPIRGFGSKNIVKFNSFFEYRKSRHFSDKMYIPQRLLQGDEYSVDSYFDKNYKWIDSVVRKRIRIGSSGEVVTSKTVEFNELRMLTKSIGESLELRGPINTQYIVEDGNIYIIEINARFGGGFTFSMAAGMDIINLIKRDYFNLDFEYISNSWKKNFLLERAYKDYYFENSN